MGMSDSGVLELQNLCPSGTPASPYVAKQEAATTTRIQLPEHESGQPQIADADKLLVHTMVGVGMSGCHHRTGCLMPSRG